MATISKRALLANTFGTFGYLSCLLQWLFVSLLYLPLLLDNKQLKSFLLPEPVEQPTRVIAASEPSLFLIVIAGVFTVLMLIFTVYIMLRAPFAIAKTGKSITKKTAEAIVPLVVHHKLSPAKERILTVRLIKIIKLIIVIVPLLINLSAVLVPLALPQDVTLFVGASLAIGSLIWFSLQYISAWALKVRLEKLI